MLSIRKIGALGRTYRHLNRYRQILAVLIKFGFGDLVARLNLERLPGFRATSQRSDGTVRLDKLGRAERVRLALQELGPTYIKLGQLLSTRPDLIPYEFLKEFSKLQDKVPSFEFEATEEIIQKSLGRPLSAVFNSFERTPLASASIGQVYQAGLNSGEIVAVKVQRPGIRRTVEVDLEIMLHLATLVENHLAELALHRPVKIVEEFAHALERELDYTIEAANMSRAARYFFNDRTVHIPAVFHEFTTSRVLTMAFVHGIKINDLTALQQAGYDLPLITARGADLYLKQIFDYGFFHADPHPGNIYVLPRNVICLFDFGMVGSIDRRTRELFIDLVDRVVHRQEAQVVAVLLQLADYEHLPDLRRLEEDVADFIGRHLFKPLKEIETARLLHHLLELASRHRLRIPANLFLMLKALATVEGVALALNPDFDLVTRAAPFIQKAKLARLAPDRLLREVMQFISQWQTFLGRFPRDAQDITQQIRQGELVIRVQPEGVERLLETHDQTSNRMAFAIIIAALIIGSALIVISETPPLFYGISLIGIIGFFAAAVLGIWLLVAIIRRGL